MTLPLRVSELHVSYRLPDGQRVMVIPSLSLQLDSGGQLGIQGPSGSGKTTLLYALAGLTPATGEIHWGSTSLLNLKEAERDRWRLHHLSFLFQDIHLFPKLTVMENVLFPLTLRQWRITSQQQQAARDLLAHLGLSDLPSTQNLSRGEMQRVAAARALITEPQILLADEPTASLDADNAQLLAQQLQTYCQERGVTLMVASHDLLLLERMSIRGQMERGALQLQTSRIHE